MKTPPKRKTDAEPVVARACIEYVGKKPDMFQHADFTNRHFHGLLDLSKATNLHGDTVYEAGSTGSYTFAYARLTGFWFGDGRYTIVTRPQFPFDIIWVLRPTWMEIQRSMLGSKFIDYPHLLDNLCVYKVTGRKLNDLVAKGLLEIKHSQKK